MPDLSRISFAAIDVGVQYYGGALFEFGQLIWADKESRDEISSLALEADYVIVERPRKANDDKSRRAVIQDVEFAAGFYLGKFKDGKGVLASSIPKKIRHARAAAALSSMEFSFLPKQKGRLQHVLCAVYIGLKELGRV